MGGDTSVVKKNTIEIQWQIRANGKHQVWKAKGRAMDLGESPGHQSQSQYLGNSPSDEEMGHWTPTGIEPTDYDDDNNYPSMQELPVLPNQKLSTCFHRHTH